MPKARKSRRPPPEPAPAPEPEEAPEEAAEKEEAGEDLAPRLRSWGVSLGIHLVLLLILAFIVLSEVVAPRPEAILAFSPPPREKEEIAPPPPTPQVDQTVDHRETRTTRIAEATVTRSETTILSETLAPLAPRQSATAAGAGGGTAAAPISALPSVTASDYPAGYLGIGFLAPAPPAGLRPVETPGPVTPAPVRPSGGTPVDSQNLGKRMDAGFRERSLADFGGNAASEEAVYLGLDWLVRKQEPDGRWSARRWGGFSLTKRHDMHKWLSNEQAETAFDIGVTGLCVLAFLGAGITPDYAPEQFDHYREAVRKALKWLCDQQQANGEWPGSMYGHGIATLALAEAYGMTGNYQAAASRGVTYICRTQNPFGGWNYHTSRGNARNDTSITGWQVMALKSALMAGIPFNQRVLNQAESCLRAAGAEQSSGDYRQNIIYARAADGAIERVQSARSGHLAITAIAMLSLQYMGWEHDHPFLRAKTAELLAAGPQMDNFYYTYYATLTMFQAGGDDWRRWNAQMRDALIAEQDQEMTDDNGSWPPQPRRWGEQGGRAYTTALAIMCLEVYYRYLPLYEDGEH